MPADQPTFQAGIDSSGNGDTVLVASGTYSGTGNRNIDFSGKSILLKSEHGSDSTIIDCGGAIRGFYFHNHEDSMSVLDGFTIQHGFFGTYGGGLYCTHSSPSIINCILQRNRTQVAGGAIACIDSSSPIITNCIFGSNTCDNTGRSVLGGAFYCSSYSSPKITRCSFNGNRVDSDPSSNSKGGGIYFGDHCNAVLANSDINNNWSGIGGGIMCSGFLSSPILENCIFHDNYAISGCGVYCGAGASPMIQGCAFYSSGNEFAAGAGVFLFNATAIIDSCNFSHNYAPVEGGGIALYYSPVVIRNCLFYGNMASHGGGVSCHNADSVDIISCIFDSDSSGLDSEGGSALWLDNSSINIANCTFVNNCSDTSSLPGSTVGCVLNSWPIIVNSIMVFNTHFLAFYCDYNSQPSLYCTDIFGNQGGDWEWCILTQQDTNSNMSSNPLFCDREDHDFHISENSPCAPQNNSCGVLIGALGAACNPNGVKDSSAILIPLSIELLKAYPNPFNAQTSINYSLSKSGPVNLFIYNLLGQKVATLIYGIQQAGEHSLIWNAKGFTSGVYFARLEAEGESPKVEKMILLK